MDTRRKILSLQAAKELRCPFTLATGRFDVLRADHVREFAAIRNRSGGPLLVAVLPAEDEVLPQQARAELVAGLRVVDYVLAARPQELDELRPAKIVRMETADAQRTQQLIEHVHRRQSR